MKAFTNGYVLLDGATGTNLQHAGMPFGVCVEQWVLEHPDVLVKLQKEYIAAGSDVVYAPTFGANSVSLARYGLEGLTARMNKELVALSRSAVGNSALVAASVSTTGIFVRPFSDTSFKELLDVYREQITAVKEAGADYVCGETLMSMADLRAVAIACRELEIPFTITVTVDENGRTLAGMSASAAVVTAQALGAFAVGVNCSGGPDDVLKAVSAAKKYAKVPLIGKPNCGNPSSPLAAEEFIAGCKKLLDSGVTVIGGCCGTNASNIASLRSLIDCRSERFILPSSDITALAGSMNAFELPAKLKLTEPVYETNEYASVYCDMDWSEFDILTIGLTTDNALNAAEEAYLYEHPLAFRAREPEALETALLGYQGRAAVLNDGKLDYETIKSLSDKYGALLMDI